MASKVSINSLSKDKELIESFPKDRLLSYHLSLNMVTSLIDITLPLKEKNIM